MAEIVRMPKMSDTMTEGVVAKWHKNIGDTIKSGELVAEIETDKATMEFESFQDGVLLYKGVEEGKSAPVDGILAILGKAGEDYKSLLDEESKKQTAPPADEKSKVKEASPKKEKEKESVEAAVPETAPAPETTSGPVSRTSDSDSRIKASPLAKKLAEGKGIDLTKIKGSGEGGRVVKRDVDWFKTG